ncbi:uncharacterized protein [Lepidochelys kempii]|uniref:uncharacterized protein n=1 Tax=Lepidochelys kempii TaxID=8472 RepID=UPI003C6EAAD8
MKDAYFHLAIHPAHRQFLRFTMGQEHYQFAVLPFGLAMAPRVFTKCMAVVVAFLRRQGIWVYPYLDNWLLGGRAEAEVRGYVEVSLRLTRSPSSRNNVPKLTLMPMQKVEFIGTALDVVQARASYLPWVRNELADYLSRSISHARVDAQSGRRTFALPQDSVKWLPKSPKLYSGHNWSSQSSRWASLKGKESFRDGNVYKFNSGNENWKEGRVSPEQEAEELEDPDEDEPISKFSGSLFDTDDNIKDQRNPKAAVQEKHKAAVKAKPFPEANNKPQAPASTAGSFPADSNRFPEEMKEQVPRAAEVTQSPLKAILIARVAKDGPADLTGVQGGDKVLEGSILLEPNTPDSGPGEAPAKSSPFQTVNHIITIPRIILTRPSTSDEDTDQLTHDPDDFEPEEMDSAESQGYSECLNNAFYPP